MVRRLLPVVLLSLGCSLRAEPSLDEQAALRIRNFKIEDGFAVSLFGDEGQLRNPSAICFDDRGRLYVAEIDRWRAGVEDIRNRTDMLRDDLAIVTSEDRRAMYRKFESQIPASYWTQESDRVRLLEDRDGDGRADHVSTFADGFRDALDGPGIGLIHGPGGIYYTNIPHLWLLRDGDRDGVSEERVSLQEGFGTRISFSGHDMHGLAWGPDGRLYWSVGDRGYHLVTKEGRTFSAPGRGAVFRCEPDGSGLEVFHAGLRNPQELAFDRHGNLFTCDNDADAWDDGRLVQVLEGGDSGWDAGHQNLMNFAAVLRLRTPALLDERDQKTRPISPWLAEGLCRPRFPGQPTWILPPVENVSWGPSGLVYNYGGTTFPERYADSFFVCNFGGAKGDLEAFAVDPQGAGFRMRHWTKSWMIGLGNTDAEFGPDGRLYVSCFNNNGWYKQDLGNIYAMDWPERRSDPVVLDTRRLLTTPWDGFSPERLGQLLGHADLRVRQRAQFALVALRSHGAPWLLEAAQPGPDPIRRLHGVWGLGQLLRVHRDLTARDHLISLLGHDADAEVRNQAARMLGDASLPEAGPALADALGDASPRVRYHAAVGVGRCGHREAREALVRLLDANADEDPVLRHGAVVGLSYLSGQGDADAAWLTKRAREAGPPVRRGVVLALRRLHSPRLAAFLDDPDRSIADEAARAIHDLPVPDALPALATRLGRDRDGGIPAERDHPAGWLMELRLVNANWRLGDSASAERLLAYAANPSLPGFLRTDALAALESWADPGPVDPVTGRHLPLDAASRADVSALVRARLPALGSGLQGELLAAFGRLASRVGYRIPDAVLETWARDSASGVPARLQALRELRQRNAPAVSALFSELVSDPADDVRGLAARLLAETDPARGVAVVLGMAASERLRDRQQAIEILGTIDSDPARAALGERLDAAVRGEADAGSLFELLEAAAKHPALAGKLAAYTQSLDPADPLAPFRECLEGGDPRRGADHFANHAAAQCNKCHIVGTSGGIAGPNLSDIGKRHDTRYLLEALVNPSAVVVPGYGLTMITRKDGTSVAGSLVRETADELVVRIGETGTEETVPLAAVASRTPPVSAMPPMGYLLPKREIRDLVAYLATLKTAPPAGH
jgi:quinoprotein glucose dehydrogenase